jgi:hypothetical protein
MYCTDEPISDTGSEKGGGVLSRVLEIRRVCPTPLMIVGFPCSRCTASHLRALVLAACSTREDSGRAIDLVSFIKLVKSNRFFHSFNISWPA